MLNTISLSALSGVNQILAEKFFRLGIKNIQDLLLYLPIRYENHAKVLPIRKALSGMAITVQGKILNSKISYNPKRMLTCYLRDNNGEELSLRFFYFSKAMESNLSKGKWITAFGKVYHYKYSDEMIHPKYRVINKSHKMNLPKSLTPIYQTIKGLRQETFRKIIDQALKMLEIVPSIELLPRGVSYKLVDFQEALRTLHHPLLKNSLEDEEAILENCRQARYRLVMEELLAHNLSLLSARDKLQNDRAMPLNGNDFLSQRFVTSLPFDLTFAQKRVAKEINQDLKRNTPMMRLLQGDVGSGKTLIAALAALRAISSGRQVVLIAPTELLAEQHIQKFRNWFLPLGIKIGWLVGRQTEKNRQKQLEAICDGRIMMVIGTHAVFQKQVYFANLALIIIDEHHRFGVHQRLSLLKKGFKKGLRPHQLIMTATPIPRTLSMTAYSYLDNSIIDELPPGRMPVTTVVVTDKNRNKVIQRVCQACLQENRQAYWVCPVIEKSNIENIRTVKSTWQELKNALPEVRVELLHGRMKTFEKNQLMEEFKVGNIKLLVTTTVIEVGINIPNASLIIIENSERLGLTQLHQLRGRVGRSSKAAYCVLLYKSPINKKVHSRLKILRENNDGFIISEFDMKIRGPGDLFGFRQTGNSLFRVANLIRDQEMIPIAYRLAQHIHKHYPDAANELMKRWMPDRMRYYTFT
ncbi:ATP-dependent DNA helicase RecG [Sodalis sp. CWE]|uniref:ATP-dependent DNA helicase RecG n=1 Tax=Sodalis sp. CWE TaxID=2803816 RepID=UPI001C7DC690|nr:ATP-dependent DNA helicase RecG [Sodalis sp. CWE]MBX4180970.1 ATP-dependent DNA helicase RecG [Sodalis sp. CWE]